MDGARRSRTDLDLDDYARMRVRPEPARSIDGLEKVLRFAAPGRDGEDLPRERAPTLTARDITQAIDLVQEAAQTIKAAEERARDGEARTQALLQRATDELKSSEARYQAAEMRARLAEARAQECELRAREAENWLRQIYATISSELPQPR